MVRLALLILTVIQLAHAEVFVIKWEGPITPIAADYIDRTLSQAEREEAKLFVIELNTPGGLVDSMRRIIQRMENSPIPVVVYVYPPGGRAASAGAIITLASDIAVMAPGTNIGAAHPVQMGGPAGGREDNKEQKDILQEKALQDMLALVRSIAKTKGRNVEIAEKMVRESLSLTSDEALKYRVIDMIAVNLDELLKKVNGKKLKKLGREIKVELEGYTITYLEPNFKEELLKIITNPTVAYLLLMIGFYGIFFELYSPGALIPGIVGAISLLLGLYGLAMISMNWLGLLLIVLGVLFFILELVTPTFGALAVGGIISLALGSLFLIDPESPYGNIPKSVIVTVVFASALFFLLAGRLGLRAQKLKKLTGAEGMVGEEGEAITDFLKGKGKVLVHGEIWDALSEQDIKKGEQVRVIGLKGLRLIVERLSSSPE